MPKSHIYEKKKEIIGSEINSHRQPESNQSQNKSTEIKQACLTHSFFTQNAKSSCKTPSVQVTGVLRNWFMLTYSRGTRYPESASSIHTTSSQDLLPACQQILYFNLRSIQTGQNWCRTRRGASCTTTSTLKFMITTPQGGVNQCCVYGFISLNASCDLLSRLQGRWVAGVHRLIYCLCDEQDDS